MTTYNISSYYYIPFLDITHKKESSLAALRGQSVGYEVPDTCLPLDSGTQQQICVWFTLPMRSSMHFWWSQEANSYTSIIVPHPRSFTIM